ncbi:MAG: GlsB/YeaQ/YmgE family stress response membrane protein [Candidatus Acidiferrales bacterium]
MQLLFWATYGLVAGWLAGKIITLSQGRDQLLDVVLGTAGGIGGGFLFDATPFRIEGKMIYTSLAAALGGVILTLASRYFTTARHKYDSMN